jgi:ABC-type multidrug transport system ATPase subunit
MQGRTSIVIAHRLSTVIAADKIMVIEKGVITAEGGHAELLGKSDKYKELYKALKSTQITCFSVLFNAVFDQDNQLSDYYGGMVVDGYVVDIEESFDVASLNPNGMSLTVKIVVNTIKYVGRQTTKELQLNFA